MKNQPAESHFCNDLQRFEDQEIDATTHTFNYTRRADLGAIHFKNCYVMGRSGGFHFAIIIHQ